MKNYLFLLLASFVFLSCNYEIPTEDLVKFEIIDHNNNSIELDLESSKKLLKAAKSTNEWYIWKGHKEGVLTYKDGSSEQLRVSNYGGFFHSEEYDKIFNIPEEYRDDWNELVGIKVIRRTSSK